MATTVVQLEVEDWVRRVWLRERFGQEFRRERMQLISGGMFDFDAVSADEKIVAAISTSSCRTASGKLGVGKFMKIRSDMYFLLLLAPPRERRLVVLTDRSMFDRCMKERDAGRVPPSIEFLHAEVPKELAVRLAASQQIASREVTPGGGVAADEG